MNFRCLVESILNETAVEQNVVEFFALELAKRLIVDSYYATEGDDYADDLEEFLLSLTDDIRSMEDDEEEDDDE